MSKKIERGKCRKEKMEEENSEEENSEKENVENMIGKKKKRSLQKKEKY